MVFGGDLNSAEKQRNSGTAKLWFCIIVKITKKEQLHCHTQSYFHVVFPPPPSKTSVTKHTLGQLHVTAERLRDQFWLLRRGSVFAKPRAQHVNTIWKQFFGKTGNQPRRTSHRWVVVATNQRDTDCSPRSCRWSCWFARTPGCLTGSRSSPRTAAGPDLPAGK